MNEPSLRWASAADTDMLLALFARAFGSRISADEWRWKYPQPARHSLVALRNGRVLAHYGGQPRRLLGLGEAVTAMQVSDIMVDPAERGAGGRQGLFVRMARQFTQAVTEPEGEHAFTYGFPSPRATRLGELLGMYQRLDRLEQLLWTPDTRLAARRVRECELPTMASLGDLFWALQRQALGAEHLLGVRDAHWLQTRYLDRPETRYEGLLYHDAWRRPQAALVFRRHAETLELLDLLGHPSGYTQLLQALRCRAAELQKQAVLAWLTPAAQGALPQPRQRETALQVNLAGPQAAAQVKRFALRCWMTAGDTDYR